MSDQRLPPFAPPTDAAVLEEQARNPGTKSGYYFGDDASKPDLAGGVLSAAALNNVPMQDRVSPISADHRYWQTVILREDQVDLIARRVVELLGVELPTRFKAFEEDPTPPVSEERRCDHHWASVGGDVVRCQVTAGHEGPHIHNAPSFSDFDVPEERMLATEVTPLEGVGWDESD